MDRGQEGGVRGKMSLLVSRTGMDKCCAMHGEVCALQTLSSSVRNASGKSSQREREINALNK